ncbi:DUF4857 domain-containing protein [Puteibacter caeruleilacunae]|nr:DUF4857 domain-containing protein [Puteibacter caeruleilacunae]
MECKARIVLIIAAIAVLAVYLPYFMWIGFSEMSFRPQIEYSPLEETFIIKSMKGAVSREGKEYSAQEMACALPFSKYKELAVNDALPDSVKDFKWDTKVVQQYNEYKIFSPYYFNMKSLGLYPLFDTNIVGSVIKPDDYFRLNDRIEFVDAATNKIKEELSQKYTQIMREHGFEFPGQKVFGSTSSMKRYDEGYFMVDAEGKVFHVLKRKGKFKCIYTKITNGLQFKKMHVLTSLNRKLYGLVATIENELYVLTTNDYGYIKIPIEYNSDFQKLSFRATVLNYQFSIHDGDETSFVVTDRRFNAVDQYKYIANKSTSYVHSELIPAVFPFILTTQNRNSRFFDPSIEIQKKGWMGNIVCVILFVLGLLIWKKKLVNNISDIIFISVFGIYALIAVFVFPNFKNLSFKG